MIWYCIDCGNVWEHDDTACPECGSLNFERRGKSQITKQHCTQCEIGSQNLELIAENERLKEVIKETFVNNLHIFCPSCKEKDCLCMLDSTCEKLRNILDGKI